MPIRSRPVFPAEIYQEIMGYCSDRETLASWARVCTLLCSLAQRRLFRHINLDFTNYYSNLELDSLSLPRSASRRVKEFPAILRKSPHLARYVQNVDVIVAFPDYRDVPEDVEILFEKILPRLTRLHKLTLSNTRLHNEDHVDPRNGSKSLRHLESIVLHGHSMSDSSKIVTWLWKRDSFLDFAQFRRLEFKAMEACEGYQKIEGIMVMCKNVQELSLMASGYAYSRHETSDGTVKTFYKQQFLPPSLNVLPYLRKLTIEARIDQSMKTLDLRLPIFPSHLPWITDLLQTIPRSPPSRITEIAIVFNMPSFTHPDTPHTLRVLDWSVLTNLLSNRLPSLHRAEIDIRGPDMDKGSKAELRSVLEENEHLSRLISNGILVLV